MGEGRGENRKGGASKHSGEDSIWASKEKRGKKEGFSSFFLGLRSADARWPYLQLLGKGGKKKEKGRKKEASSAG